MELPRAEGADVREEAEERSTLTTPEEVARREAVLCFPDDLLPLAVVQDSRTGNLSEDRTACNRTG